MTVADGYSSAKSLEALATFKGGKVGGTKHCPDSGTRSDVENLLRVGVNGGEKKFVIEHHSVHMVTRNR